MTSRAIKRKSYSHAFSADFLVDNLTRMQSRHEQTFEYIVIVERIRESNLNIRMSFRES